MAKVRKTKHNIMNFNAIFHEEEDGGYSVSVPALPGCYSQGDNFEEAVSNIQEAIELYLDDKDARQFVVSGRREFIAPVSIHG